MARAAGVVICGVCTKREPSQVANHHHVHPKAFGGPDTEENLVWLCASCHDLLHRAAEHLVHGRKGRAFDLVETAFPTNPARRQDIYRFAGIAAEAEMAWKESGVQSEYVTVKIKLPRELHAKLTGKASEKKKRIGKYLEKVLAAVADDPRF